MTSICLNVIYHIFTIKHIYLSHKVTHADLIPKPNRHSLNLLNLILRLIHKTHVILIHLFAQSTTIEKRTTIGHVFPTQTLHNALEKRC